MTAEGPSAWHTKARLFLDKPEGGRSLLVAEEVEVDLAWHSLRSDEGVGLRFEASGAGMPGPMPLLWDMPCQAVGRLGN